MFNLLTHAKCNNPLQFLHGDENGAEFSTFKNSKWQPKC